MRIIPLTQGKGRAMISSYDENPLSRSESARNTGPKIGNQVSNLSTGGNVPSVRQISHDGTAVTTDNRSRVRLGSSVLSCRVHELWADYVLLHLCAWSSGRFRRTATRGSRITWPTLSLIGQSPKPKHSSSTWCRGGCACTK